MADLHPTIFNLPSDILSDIFEFLPHKDLIQLTTVCKLFNNVISHSSKLLIKLPLDVSRSSVRLWTASRDYNNLIVPADSINRRMPIIKSLTDKIVRLKIGKESRRHQQNSDIDDLLELLEKMPKLRHLDINLHPNFETRLSGKTLALKLDSLSAYIGRNMLPLFNNCGVKCFETGYSDYAAISELLLKFQESLQCLELRDIDERVMRVLPGCNKLKMLKIAAQYHHLKGYTDIVLQKMENLTMSGNIDQSLHLSFPNLKHLTLRQPSNIRVIGQFTKIESLKIFGYALIPRTTAKKLTLIRSMPKTRPFDFDDNDFEEIFVVKNEEKRLKWLDDFIEGGFAAKLKTFRVKQVKNANSNNEEEEDDD